MDVLDVLEWVPHLWGAHLFGLLPPSWPYPDARARASRICHVDSGVESSSEPSPSIILPVVPTRLHQLIGPIDNVDPAVLGRCLPLVFLKSVKSPRAAVS